VIDRARLKEVFASVADAPLAERARLLDELCGADAELRAEVEELLSAEAAVPELLARPPLGTGIGALVDRALAAPHALEADPEPIGTIGRYTIVRKIAAGGMGAIYEALQDSPHRKVALKLIRGLAATAELRQRLRREAEALGRLQHPSIAAIYDAGSAPVAFSDGSSATLPFLAMELVDGEPLHRYAAHRSLALRARVELLAEIAEAVQHAHQQGVIHRDLKPANILISQDGRPKVLDFGIARVIDLEAEGSMAHTREGQILGTLAYMSPEQVRGGSVDTRSDIYSLGVIAFELLAGRAPLAIDASSIAGAARTILEVAPPSLGAVAKALRGDLATIVDKALEKEPARRYASAAELAADLRRYLQGRPIHAHPPSTLYVAKRFALRHKVFVGALAAIFAILVAATAISASAAYRAEREAIRAKEVARFLRSMLEGVKPAVARTMDTALLQHLLQRTVERLDAGELAREPDVEAELRVVVATTYERIAKSAEAIAMYEKAIPLYARAHGVHAFRTLETRNGLIGARLAAGDVATAETELQALRGDIAAHAEGEEGEFLEHSVEQALGMLLAQQRRHGEALQHLQRAHAGWSARFGERSGLALSALNALGGCYAETGQIERAIECYARTLELTIENVGAEHPNVAILETNLATALLTAGRADEARERTERAIALQRAVLPAHHPSLAMSLTILSRIVRTSDVALAERALEEALQSYGAFLGPEHASTAAARIELGDWLAARGELARAIQLFEHAHAELGERKAPEAALRELASRLAALYERWQAAEPTAERAERAAAWRARSGS
jgi:tetratricopeptide (TPR) repeat protein